MKEITSNGSMFSITQAIEEMKAEQGNKFCLETINLAELSRRTGVSRGKLRYLKQNGFRLGLPSHQGHKHTVTKLTGYTGIIDTLLKAGVSNSSVILDRLRDEGYKGGQTIIKDYISSHRSLIPAKRQQIQPQGNRGRRYSTEPGEAFQMDWGFTDVITPDGSKFRVACFAMICHSCGKRYIEFFPNARQENLFIGMVHAFQYMGVPQYVLTDNMKSVIIRRDLEGHPVWQKDYLTFMNTVGFETKLCKPRHPFTKGAVERLVRYVKENFLTDRVFNNLTDLNWQAREWCGSKNGIYHRSVNGIPQQMHSELCGRKLNAVPTTDAVRCYLCPERRISFDGFVNYEGRRFGVPYSYSEPTARVCRNGDTLYIYSADLSRLLTSHDVTWSRADSFCDGQYSDIEQPEEFPTAPVKVQIKQIPQATGSLSFAKFNFDEED